MLIEIWDWFLFGFGFCLWTYVIYQCGYMVNEIEWLKHHNKRIADKLDKLEQTLEEKERGQKR